MKFKKIALIFTTLLLIGCSSKDVVLTKKYRGSWYHVDQSDPRYVECEFYTGDNYTNKVSWKGIIDRWIIDNTLLYYQFYWCEYSNGTHAISVGPRQ